MTRIYLDNAATSWPKPEAVYEAVDDYLRRSGAPAGRSGYGQAADVARQVTGARGRIAELAGLDDPGRVIFCGSGTDALNLALHGLLRPGDHVVTSVVEHNSVLRPLRHLEQSSRLEVTHVGCDGAGRIDPADIHSALRPTTRLVALTHASNVTGAIQPLEEVGRQLAEHPARLLVDAAQTLGHFPLSMEQLGCDLLAAPGHKGLLGPLGTGLLLLGAGVEEELDSMRQGGTGSRSEQDVQPDELPDKYEAGNLNVPGIVGLAAGVEYVLNETPATLRRHEVELTTQMRTRLAAIEGVTLYGPRAAADCVGVVSFNLAGYDPQQLAAVLDASFGVQVRAGLHCAPRMHAALGTLAAGGTVRISVGPFTTKDDVEAAAEAVGRIAAAAPVG